VNGVYQRRGRVRELRPDHLISSWLPALEGEGALWPTWAAGWAPRRIWWRRRFPSRASADSTRTKDRSAPRARKRAGPAWRAGWTSRWRAPPTIPARGTTWSHISTACTTCRNRWAPRGTCARRWKFGDTILFSVLRL